MALPKVAEDNRQVRELNLEVPRVVVHAAGQGGDNSSGCHNEPVDGRMNREKEARTSREETL